MDVPYFVPNVTLLCQRVGEGMAGLAGNGNSGAPVFQITNNPEPADVTLHGILWGNIRNTTNNYFFSVIRPMGIQNPRDLGQLKTCGAVFDC